MHAFTLARRENDPKWKIGRESDRAIRARTVAADTGLFSILRHFRRPSDLRRAALTGNIDGAREQQRMKDGSDATQLLKRASDGDQEAVEALVPLVYDELRAIAHARLRGERSGHTLSTTALVHEAYLKLVDINQVQWRDRAHFFAVASRMMRRVLVDYAKARGAEKRGGGWRQVELEEMADLPPEQAQAIEDLDEALTRLEKMSPRQSRLLEHRYFGGLKMKECAEVLGVSIGTVKNELRFARAWLARELGAQTGA